MVKPQSILRFILTLTLIAALTGCKKDSSPASEPASAFSENKNCVQVFYDDRAETAAYSLLQAKQTYNLLGHFAGLERRLVPISQYALGQLDICPSNIYLGSDYYSPLPANFISDFKTTKSRVAWLGYSFWSLGPDLTNIFGVQFTGFTDLDQDKKTGQVGFFQDVLYRGETFQKFIKANSNASYECACEVSKFNITEPGRSQILAEIRHSQTGEKIPWALRAGDKFLFAELPFTYAHESDRYLVFADLLFDIVGAKPLHKKHYAVIRLEDIHMRVSKPLLTQALQILKNEKVPAHLSMIPFFHDPLGVYGAPTPQPVPMTDDPKFTQVIQKAVAGGAVLVWHGVTHQFGQTANPENGVSGMDYEFWDVLNNRPTAGESTASIEERLEEGHKVFKAAGLAPQIWLTPHYTASPLSNSIFAKKLYWTMGRAQYYTADLSDHVTQFFPYEISGDAYGAFIIPENLNYVSSERSVQDMLKDAKRNLVLRDVWASAFYHPYLLESENPKNTKLQQLVRGLKNLGYEFINLESEIVRAPKVHHADANL